MNITETFWLKEFQEKGAKQEVEWEFITFWEEELALEVNLGNKVSGANK